MLCILTEFVVPRQPKVFHTSDRKKNSKDEVALTEQKSSLSGSLDPSPSVLPGGMELSTDGRCAPILCRSDTICKIRTFNQDST
jgi:hypothetical protein